MGKKKGGRRPNRRRECMNVFQSVTQSDDDVEEIPDPNPSSRSFFFDEIEDFREQDKTVFDEERLLKRPEDDSDAEGVYQLSADDSMDDDDDDDDDGGDEEEKKVYRRFEMLANKNTEMDANFEKRTGRKVSGEKAWGKEISDYYSADYVDEYRNVDRAELTMARGEEHEALAIQQRMVEQLKEQDFDLNLIQPTLKVVPAEDTKEEFKIERDLKSMTMEQKIQAVKQESPELLSLMVDFKDKMSEIRDVIRPMIELVEENEIQPGPETDYLLIKYQLLLNYCTNVCFYVMLKAQRVPTHDHPIINRLITYRKIIKELEPLDNEMKKTLQEISDSLLTRASGVGEADKTSEKKPVQFDETAVDNAGIVSNTEESKGVVGKREITSVMLKNKGVIPIRKKVDKNPRMRYKQKFTKALKRRKGQVQQVKKETERYAGELSGINMHVSHSIKL